VARRSRGRGFFVSDGEGYGFAALRWVSIVVSNWVARNLSGDKIQVLESCSMLCVPYDVSTDPLTGVS
jgi:hypothetical protein